MVIEFDKLFKELIDEDIPMVMLTSKENDVIDLNTLRKNILKNTAENIFVKEFCEEY